MLATGTVWNWKLFCSVFRPWATLCQCVCFKHCVMQHLSVCQVCVCISFTFHAAFLSVSVCWCQFDATLTFQYIGCAGISVMQQFSIYQVCGHQFHAALAINHLQSITVPGAWVSVSVIHAAFCNLSGVWTLVSCSILQSVRCEHQFHVAFCNQSGVWASVSCHIFQSIRCVGVSFMQLSDSATTCRVTSKARISAVWSAASCLRVRNDLTPMPSYMMRRDESHSHVSTVGRWVTDA